MAGFTERLLASNTHMFGSLGRLMANRNAAFVMMCLGFTLLMVLSIGIGDVDFETNLTDLWIEVGSRAESENDFFVDTLGGSTRFEFGITSLKGGDHKSKTASDVGVLYKEALYAHGNATAIGLRDTSVTLDVRGTDYSFDFGDVCNRPAVPHGFTKSSAASSESWTDAINTYLTEQRYDSGMLMYFTQCIGAIGAGKLLGARGDLTVMDYQQLQMWYGIDSATIETAYTDTATRDSIIASRPGLPPGWGVDRFPCRRAHVLDCWSDGDFDYPQDLQDLAVYSYGFSALTSTDVLVPAGSSNPSLQNPPISMNPTGAEATWFQTCAGRMSTVDAAGHANLATALSVLEPSTLTFAIGIGYWWRPSIEDQADNLGEEFFKSLQNSVNPAYRAAGYLPCVVAGAMRRFDQLELENGFKWFAFGGASANTTLNPVGQTGGCCLSFAATKVAEGLFLGGDIIPSNWADYTTPIPSSSQYFIGAFRTMGSAEDYTSPYLQSRWTSERGIPTGLSHEEIRDIIEGWEAETIKDSTVLWQRKAGSGYATGEEYEDLSYTFITGRSIGDMLSDASELDQKLVMIGYIILICYAISQFVFFHCGDLKSAIVYSRATLCFISVVIIVLAVIASFGFFGWLGDKLSPTNALLIPFLALGLGIDDLFIFLDSLQMNANLQSNVELRMANTMADAGSSVTVTSLANFTAFMIASTVPLPAVYTFSFHMAASVLINWLCLLLIIGPFMMFDSLRVSKSFALCMLVRTEVTEEEFTEKINSSQSIIMYLSPHHFTKHVLIPAYRMKVVKAIVLIIWAVLTGVLFYLGTENTETGLALSDVALEGTQIRDYVDVQESAFRYWPSDVITSTVDYPNRQAEITQVLTDLDGSTWLAQTNPSLNAHWLTGLIRFYNSLPTTTTPVTEIPAPAFYPTLQVYLTTLAGASSADELICRVVATGASTTCEGADGTNIVIVATKGAFYVRGIATDDDYVDAIVDTRGRVDNSRGNAEGCCTDPRGAKFDPRMVFVSGTLYKFWQQYVDIEDTAIEVIGYALLGVFVATLLCQASPVSTILVMIMILSTVLQMYGFMHILDVKLNAFSVVNLTVAVGMTVEFTAHFAYSFLRSQAYVQGNDDRMGYAMMDIFPPMLYGVVTTIISVACLAFAEYPFFFNYYFQMLTILLVMAFFNGMVVLPIILSILGPAGLSAQARHASMSTGKDADAKQDAIL